MPSYVPSEVFLTKGVGIHRDELRSFELALRDAKIEKYNLVYVSSILPPNCAVVPREKGLERLCAGEIVHCVMSRNSTNEPHRLVSAAIGVALPKDENNYGYLSEHHAFGQNEKVSGEHAEDLAASMLASTLGVEFDPEQAWDERKEVYIASGHFFKTSDICQSAVCPSANGDKDTLWTTVIAAAVFCSYRSRGELEELVKREGNSSKNQK